MMLALCCLNVSTPYEHRKLTAHVASDFSEMLNHYV